MTRRTIDRLACLWADPSAHDADMESVNLRAMSPFQRALLILDGTVTRFIETYTLEPTEIRLLSQQEMVLDRPNPALVVQESTKVGLREVLIEGRYSRVVYAYAASCLVLERLPPEAVERLQRKGEGIGRVIRDLQLESRREIFWYGREHLTGLPEALQGRSDGEFVSRTYRIIMNKLPLVVIHERFPASLAEHTWQH